MSKTKKCPGKESFERINYLHQISNATATEDEPSNVASTLYANLLVTVAKKSVQRLDVDLKRTICKGCRCLLLAGVTCKVRVKKKKLRWTCNQCQTTKTFDMKNRNYTAWSHREESLVGTLDYACD